jgi:hypothetical protein
MSLQPTDFFYVQRGDDGFKMPGAQLIDFIANQEGSLNYRGTVRCDEAPFNGANSSMDPNPAVPGDIYVNTVDATVAGGWTGIVGEEIQNGQRVLFDGTNWAIVGAEAGGGVLTIQGIDPIEVDDSDEENPIISVKDAAVGQKGVVVMATNDEPLVSDPDVAVLNKTHYETLDAKLDAAVAGGVTSVEEGDGIAVDSTDPNHPIVSIDISGLNTLT